MEGDNFGKEKDKAAPLEVKREQKNAKGGRWWVLSPGIFPSAKRHSIHFTGDWMDLGAGAEVFWKPLYTGFLAPDPAGRSE